MESVEISSWGPSTLPWIPLFLFWRLALRSPTLVLQCPCHDPTEFPWLWLNGRFEISTWDPFHTALNSSVSVYMTGVEISSPDRPLSLLWSHGFLLSLIKWNELEISSWGPFHTARNSSVSVYMTALRSPAVLLHCPCHAPTEFSCL